MTRCLLAGAILLSLLDSSLQARSLLEEVSACNGTRDSWDFSTCRLAPQGGAWANSRASPGATPIGSGGLGIREQIGLQTGGAWDVANFRENVKQGYLPLPTDLTYEGLIRDYYFDTQGASNAPPCKEFFCPLYSAAVAQDPLLDSRNQTDLFLAVGLDSGLTKADAARKKLNLVILLDISGSMSAPFDQYYYDQFGQPAELSPEERTATKMDAAKEVVQGILGKLSPQDNVGVVLFSDFACTPKPFGPVSCVDMAELKRGAQRDVGPTGGTNLQSGFDMASNILRGCRECMETSLTEIENRILLITDAEPNLGDQSTEGLHARMKANAADNIFMTLVGVGLDFNTALVEAVSKVKGANYFSVHSPGDFKKRLNDEFDFAVTPLVFDLALKIDDASLAAGWKILHAYGSGNSNESTLDSDGTVMKIDTLFPAPQSEEGVKGGVVLLRLKPPTGGAANAPLQLSAKYTDRAGTPATSTRTVELPLANGGVGEEGAEYQSSGVRKAVALARYFDLLQGWMLDEWSQVDKRPITIPHGDCGTFPSDYCVGPSDMYGPRALSDGCVLQHWIVPGGCVLPPPRDIFPPLLGRWERKSQPLAVNSQAGKAMQEFLAWFEGEVAALNDTMLYQEADMLNALLAEAEQGGGDGTDF